MEADLAAQSVVMIFRQSQLMQERQDSMTNADIESYLASSADQLGGLPADKLPEDAEEAPPGFTTDPWLKVQDKWSLIGDDFIVPYPGHGRVYPLMFSRDGVSRVRVPAGLREDQLEDIVEDVEVRRAMGSLFDLGEEKTGEMEDPGLGGSDLEEYTDEERSDNEYHYISDAEDRREFYWDVYWKRG